MWGKIISYQSHTQCWISWVHRSCTQVKNALSHSKGIYIQPDVISFLCHAYEETHRFQNWMSSYCFLHLSFTLSSGLLYIARSKTFRIVQELPDLVSVSSSWKIFSQMSMGSSDRGFGHSCNAVEASAAEMRSSRLWTTLLPGLLPDLSCMFQKHSWCCDFRRSTINNLSLSLLGCQPTMNRISCPLSGLQLAV